MVEAASYRVRLEGGRFLGSKGYTGEAAALPEALAYCYDTAADAAAALAVSGLGPGEVEALDASGAVLALCDACGVLLVDDECPACHVYHGDPCGTCGRRGYHERTCSELDGDDGAAYL